MYELHNDGILIEAVGLGRLDDLGLVENFLEEALGMVGKRIRDGLSDAPAESV